MSQAKFQQLAHSKNFKFGEHNSTDRFLYTYFFNLYWRALNYSSRRGHEANAVHLIMQLLFNYVQIKFHSPLHYTFRLRKHSFFELSNSHCVYANILFETKYKSQWRCQNLLCGLFDQFLEVNCWEILKRKHSPEIMTYSSIILKYACSIT